MEIGIIFNKIYLDPFFIKKCLETIKDISNIKTEHSYNFKYNVLTIYFTYNNQNGYLKILYNEDNIKDNFLFDNVQNINDLEIKKYTEFIIYDIDDYKELLNKIVKCIYNNMSNLYDFNNIYYKDIENYKIINFNKE